MGQAKYAAFVAVCSIALLICGCGKKDSGSSQTPAPGQSAAPASTKQTPAQPQASTQAPAQAPAAAGGTTGQVPTATQLSDMAAKNRETLKQMNQGKEIAAVTTDTLKGLLPETLAGMKRTGASAERNQMMGMDMTTAKAQFEGQNDASMDLTITDLGNMAGPMRLGMVGWTMAQYNRETDSGYEKTGTYNGYKGVEEYNNESKHGKLRVFVADRFIVELDGNGVTMDTLKQTLDQLDLKKMAALGSGS